MESSFSTSCYSDDDTHCSDSDDAYEREQMEIALYSQIHFEENNEIELDGIDKASEFDNGFVIDVHGSEKTGTPENSKTADFLLNRIISEKYGLLQSQTDVLCSNVDRANARHSQKKDKIFSTKLNGASDNVDRNREVSLAEKLILGQSLDDGDADMTSKVSSRSNDDMDDDDEIGDFSNGDDSDSSSIYGILDTTDKRNQKCLDLKMNVNSPRIFNAGNNDWKINHGLESKASRGRYYKPVECFNCKQTGHLSKNCTQPKKVKVCFLCSEPGHDSRKCPQSFCFNCNEPGHDRKACTERHTLYIICSRCNMMGHHYQRCPDIWRQYHLSIKPGKLCRQRAEVRKKRPVYCYNCAEEGHLGHECEEDRMSKFVRVHTPFICRYRPVREFQLLEKRGSRAEEPPLKKKKSTHSESTARDSQNTNKRNRSIRERESEWRPIGGGQNNDMSRKYGIPQETKPEIDLKLVASTRSEGFGKKEESFKKKKQNLNFPLKNAGKQAKNHTGRNNFDKMVFSMQDNVIDSVGIDEKKTKKKKKKIDKCSEPPLEKKKMKSCSQSVDNESVKRQEDQFKDFPMGNNFDFSVTVGKNVHNDSVRIVGSNNKRGDDCQLNDELFSLRKLRSLQSVVPGVEDKSDDLDINHQVHSNEWWLKKNANNRKRRRRKRRVRQSQNSASNGDCIIEVTCDN